ncbi:TrmH family RNA methyltransferase [Aureimonas jatrophae]|nr:RNA methyltransferase [Aureimonas jatrophae]MBB3949271.1 tRNA G18 (ribose-2'-O)-methylase SpoU [Aureimonas jatrophae]
MTGFGDAGHPIRIDDPNDPRIEPYRMVRERDLTGRGGLIAEGTVVLDQLLRSRRFRPRSLLVLPARLDGLSERLARLPRDVPVYVAESAVFDRIAGFPVHRGVLAYAERHEEASDPLSGLREAAEGGGTVVVACGLSNHDNMGALFRNASVFGAAAVLLDDRCCDPLYRKAIRVSVGTVLTLPFVRLGSAGEIWRSLEELGFEALALSPAGTSDLRDLRSGPPRALFLGTEGEGLGEAFLRRHRSLRVAMASGLDSLNVATCAAIVLHRLYELRNP